MSMKTLFDKVWDSHVVSSVENGPQILYIDKHLIHEVTSPQAFNELEDRGIPVFRPNQIVATADHNTPTLNQDQPIKDDLSRQQLEQLSKNCKKTGDYDFKTIICQGPRCVFSTRTATKIISCN